MMNMPSPPYTSSLRPGVEGVVEMGVLALSFMIGWLLRGVEEKEGVRWFHVLEGCLGGVMAMSRSMRSPGELLLLNGLVGEEGDVAYTQPTIYAPPRSMPLLLTARAALAESA